MINLHRARDVRDGHDEYWSAPMRDHLEKYIADGGNVAFFSGNTCCWQVRSEDDGRALTCWKQWYDTIVGYECDGCDMKWKDGLPYPTYEDGTPETFTILATCPARWAPGDSYWYDRFPKERTGAAVVGVYTRGGTVVTTGTTDWAHGLRGEDPVVTRITRNILDRLSAPKDTQPRGGD